MMAPSEIDLGAEKLQCFIGSGLVAILPAVFIAVCILGIMSIIFKDTVSNFTKEQITGFFISCAIVGWLISAMLINYNLRSVYICRDIAAKTKGICYYFKPDTSRDEEFYCTSLYMSGENIFIDTIDGSQHQFSRDREDYLIYYYQYHE